MALTTEDQLTLEERLRRIENLLNFVVRHLELFAQEQKMASVQLQDLTEQVAQCTTVMESAETLLNQLSADIAELKDDPAALQELSDRLRSQAGELGAAIAANTPAEGEDTAGGGGVEPLVAGDEDEEDEPAAAPRTPAGRSAKKPARK